MFQKKPSDEYLKPVKYVLWKSGFQLCRTDQRRGMENDFVTCAVDGFLQVDPINSPARQLS